MTDEELLTPAGNDSSNDEYWDEDLQSWVS